jgi:hypothetical protein
MDAPAMTQQNETLPFRASWMNRLNTLIEKFPQPFWMYYLSFALLIFMVITATKWADGAYPTGTFYLPHALFAGAAAYTLGLIHWLVRGIPNSFKLMRPVLKNDEANFDELLYRLSNAPSTPVLLGSFLGLLWGIFLQQVLLKPLMTTLKLSTSPLSSIVDSCVLALTWVVLGGGIVCLIHLLRTINLIYLSYTHIQLFQPQPLYTLSNLAGRSALGVAIYALLWVALTPGTANAPAILGMLLFIEGLAAATFLIPLVGVHQLLLSEKHQLQESVGKRLHRIMAEIHDRIESGDTTGIDFLQKQMSILQTQQAILEKAPTWPWHPDTVRLVATSILIPVLVFIAQRMLGQLI